MNKDAEKEIKEWVIAISGNYGVPQDLLEEMGKQLVQFAYADAVKSLKQIERAHTYASENANHYIGFDYGVLHCIQIIEERMK